MISNLQADTANTPARKSPNVSDPATYGRLAVLSVAAYIAAQMLADIASLKIGVIAGLSVDMGTFIYPLTFTLRDVVHKVLGRANTRLLILTAGGINLIMAAYLRWSASVPGDPSWGLTEEFSAILAPVWRIVLAFHRRRGNQRTCGYGNLSLVCYPHNHSLPMAAGLDQQLGQRPHRQSDLFHRSIWLDAALDSSWRDFHL